MVPTVRPLGHKAYGSIPHLPGSRTGPSDRHVDPALAERLLSRRLPQERVLVQEKLDGSCVAVARVGDRILALGRAGDLAERSRNEGRRLFAAWVADRRALFASLLEEGERLVGEWLALAHGTRYRLRHGPFVVFDLMRGRERAIVEVLRARVGDALPLPHLLHEGGAIGVAPVLAALGEHGHHGALDPAEGAVWRLERGKRVLGIAKVVRAGKQDGVLLPDHSGRPPVWNWRPEGESAAGGPEAT